MSNIWKIPFVTPASKRASIQHLLQLSADDRYTRFCKTMSDQQIIDYVNNASGHFVGVTLFGEPGIVSLVHYTSHPDSPFWYPGISTDETKIAEVGFSTLAPHQGNGYGRMLMMFVKGLAEVDGADTLVMSGLATNKPIQHLARQAGFEVVVEYGEFEAQIKTFRSTYRQFGKSIIQLIQSPNE